MQPTPAASSNGAPGAQRRSLSPRDPPGGGRWTHVSHFFLRPGWKNLPLAASLVFTVGTLPGPPAVLFYRWLLDIHWDQVLRDPRMLLVYASLGGACHALG